MQKTGNFTDHNTAPRASSSNLPSNFEDIESLATPKPLSSALPSLPGDKSYDSYENPFGRFGETDID